MNTFFGLEIGRRALQANQTAIDVTGNNIANASTDGYTRQRVDLSASKPYTIAAFNKPTGAGQLGTGVTVEQITRLRDSFTDLMLRNQVKEQGFWDSKQEVLSKIEGLLSEPSGSGLSQVLQQFFGAWQEVSKDPSMDNRLIVLENTNGVVDFLHNFSAQLDALKQDLNKTISAKLDELNTIASQVADLNAQISKSELGHQTQDPNGNVLIVRENNANDLRDKRDLLLDKLAKYGDLKVTEDAVSGMVSVNLGAHQLVTGNTSFVIPTSTDAQGSITVTVNLGNGGIAGYLTGRDQSLSRVQANLDKFAEELVYQVNAIHTQGVDLSGQPGEDFFDPSKITASTIVLNSNISAAKIAASSPGSTASGDGSNALQIAQLQSAIQPRVGGVVPPGGQNAGENLESFWQTTLFNLGLEGKQAKDMSSNNELLVIQLENQRQQVSGVSMDEEMTSMMKYQHGYNAAARLITVMDEMVDTIVNRLGTVGR